VAQLGSFVPVKGANLPILDRIFTRIGAGDNLAQGKSTFLVEMEETASICKHATAKSLVILDEVGRGTSTFDGLALARSVVEYIHTHIKARCIFATHYHELTALPGQFQGIVTYYAASSKTVQGIQFLYKIVKGVADGSFGIEVAKLAHLPDSIIHRAYALLRQLEKEGIQIAANSVTTQQNYHELQAKLEQLQMALQKKEHQLAALQTLDYDNLSPKQALDFLWKMRELG
jgi:DNA mismatch repair protein MutS